MSGSGIRGASSGGGGGDRLPSLTGMRFLAALLVFLTHTSVASPFTDAGIDRFLGTWLGRAGFLGVGFFFVLSGFVLTWSARPGDAVGAFYRRRLVKIYPNHLVTWLAGLLLMIGAGATVTARGTVPSLLLVQSWIPRLDSIMGTNAPSWSLACELVFYLSFPLLLRWAKRIRPERLWLWAGVLTAAAFLVPVLAQALPAQPVSPWQSISLWRYWFVYFLPASRLLEFALGVLMALIVRNGRLINLSWPLALVPLAVGYLLMVKLPDAYGLAAPTALPVALLIAAVATKDLRGTGTFFGLGWMRRLGEVSFAFYLVHFLVFQYGPIGLGDLSPTAVHFWGTPEALGRLGATLLISLALAWVLHLLVEEPAMRLWGRTARRPLPAGPLPAAEAADTVPAAD
ncbi:acyltransferase family protein [Kitasatospora sp. NPDC006697]|uniref:acyltransferase family protein n=1 Tax=Kitasatospora sp. NPDC006697 TaxID=3364020 RepID=UPI00367C2328